MAKDNDNEAVHDINSPVGESTEKDLGKKFGKRFNSSKPVQQKRRKRRRDGSCRL